MKIKKSLPIESLQSSKLSQVVWVKFGHTKVSKQISDLVPARIHHDTLAHNHSNFTFFTQTLFINHFFYRDCDEMVITINVLIVLEPIARITCNCIGQELM